VNLAVPGGGGVVELKKNMVGVFHQPALVLCDVAVLDSLAPDELACGLAECVKHALIGADWNDPGLMAWTKAGIPAFLRRDRRALVELVARNVAIKAQVVEGDEREEREDGRGRMCLNMGHTVGHAIETIDVVGLVGGQPRAPGLKHGEAVSVGLVAESAMGEAMGVTRAGLTEELGRTLGACGLPTRISSNDDAAEIVVRRGMLDDKKVGGGRVRVAVPTGETAGGAGCVIVEQPSADAVGAGLKAIGLGT
jgi:3-dehydroquinate synthase